MSLLPTILLRAFTLSAVACIGFAQASPREETILFTTTMEFDAPINGNMAFGFSIPYFDNTRATLRTAMLDVLLDATLVGNYSNLSLVNPGTLIANIQATALFDTSQLNFTAGPGNLRYPLICAGSNPCYPFSLPAFRLPVGTLQLRGQGTDFGHVSTVGGSLPLAWSSSVTNGSGAFSGIEQFRGAAKVTYVFDAKTSLDYAKDAISQARKNWSEPKDLVGYTRHLYFQAIVLRESENTGSYFGPSNFNQNIKDLEYFSRGLQGGVLWGNLSSYDPDDSNDFFNLIVPVSSLIYSGGKKLGSYFPGIRDLRPDQSEVLLGNDVTNASSGLFSGLGLSNQDEIDAALLAHFGGSHLLLQHRSQRAANEFQQIKVPEIFHTDEGLPSEFRLFAATAQSGAVTIDAVGQLASIYAFAGGSARGLEIDSDALAGLSFVLFYDGGQITFAEGVFLDFASIGLAEGLSRFAIEGVPTGELFAATFSFEPGASIYIAEIQISAVPDAPTFPMAALGLLALLMMPAKRRASVGSLR